MVDLHPLTEERVEAGGSIIGIHREPDWVSTHLPNAEASLWQLVDERWYALEAETHFDMLQHFDSATELLEAKDLTAQPALARTIRSTPAPFVLREHTVLRRLRALPRPA
jgi:hypothetical protein